MTTITLEFPVELDGKTISEVTLRRPKVKDLVTAERVGGTNETLYGAALAASLSGLTLNVMNEIDAMDSLKIAGAVADLMGKSQPAAGVVSPS